MRQISPAEELLYDLTQNIVIGFKTAPKSWGSFTPGKTTAIKAAFLQYVKILIIAIRFSHTFFLIAFLRELALCIDILSGEFEDFTLLPLLLQDFAKHMCTYLQYVLIAPGKVGWAAYGERPHEMKIRNNSSSIGRMYRR